MTRKEIEQKVNDFLIDDFEIEKDKITPEANLKETLGIDSLDLVDLVAVVRREFGVKMQLEDMKKVKTLAQFYDYIEQKSA